MTALFDYCYLVGDFLLNTGYSSQIMAYDWSDCMNDVIVDRLRGLDEMFDVINNLCGDIPEEDRLETADHDQDSKMQAESLKQQESIDGLL